MSADSRVLGIDLGTTNSCAAVIDHEPVVIPLEGSNYTMPSMVAFTPDGTLVGETAARHATTAPQDTIFASKRLIGRSFDDPETQKAMDGLPYHCVRGTQGEVRLVVAGQEYGVEEVSAVVLGAIKEAAQTHLGAEITQAVITVPAYFNDRQRTATKKAGNIAGLEVLRVVNEPTSAALAYGLGKGREHNVVVYDLGGGTFDVSVLRVGGEVAEVLASAGDAFLGGHDFDQKILEWLLERVQTKNGINLRREPMALERLRAAAEAAKISLSDEAWTRIAMPFVATGNDSMPVHIDEQLKREAYESMVEELVQRTIETVRSTLAEAELEPSDVDGLLFVGGMTRMPTIRLRVQDLLQCEPMSGVHPDLVVAVGAAIHGASLHDETMATSLQDVTPHNLGIQIAAGLADTVLPKNTKLPAQITRTFATVRDNQKQVSIVVCQGSSRKIAENDVLGRFVLDGIEDKPAGHAEIDVTFVISSDGIVEVTALDKASGRQEKLRIDERIGSKYPDTQGPSQGSPDEAAHQFDGDS